MAISNSTTVTQGRDNWTRGLKFDTMFSYKYKGKKRVVYVSVIHLLIDMLLHQPTFSICIIDIYIYDFEIFLEPYEVSLCRRLILSWLLLGHCLSLSMNRWLDTPLCLMYYKWIADTMASSTATTPPFWLFHRLPRRLHVFCYWWMHCTRTIISYYVAGFEFISSFLIFKGLSNSRTWMIWLIQVYVICYWWKYINS